MELVAYSIGLRGFDVYWLNDILEAIAYLGYPVLKSVFDFVFAIIFVFSFDLGHTHTRT